MNTDKKPWTKRRVMRAYTEWKALNDHAEDVFHEYERWMGDVRVSFDRLALPGWIGSGWPGKEFEVVTYGRDYYESDHPEKIPFEYLWTTAWKDGLCKKREQWQASAAGQQAEREEKAEFERLKAKFEAAP